MNKQTRYRLSKFLSILIGCILAYSFLLSSCNVSNNDVSDTSQSLANTQWVLDYIQTKGEMMFPGDDYYSIQFIGEDSVATYIPDDSLSRRSICILCWGNYLVVPPDSIQFSWICNFKGRPIQCSSDIGFKYYELTSRVYAFRKDRQTLQLFSKPDTGEQTYTMYFNIVVQ